MIQLSERKVHYAIWDKWVWNDHTYSVVFLPSIVKVTVHVDSSELENDIKIVNNSPRIKLHLERDRELHKLISINAIISQLYQEGLDLPTEDIPVIVLNYNNFRGYFNDSRRHSTQPIEAKASLLQIL